mgnify:CR=1 FL=1
MLAYLSLAASMALVGSYVGLSKLLVLVFPQGIAGFVGSLFDRRKEGAKA